MQRLLCNRCGDSIHPDPAARNAGLCIPCTRGNQLSIEQRMERRKQEREAERAWRESPEWKYWTSLVDRVYKKVGGFEALSRGDQLYFLVNVLNGEVHNGGFSQFFSNTSGNRYRETISALAELDASSVAALLQEAKRVLFGIAEVPLGQVERYHLMVTSSEDHPEYAAANALLDELDKQFYAMSDDVAALLSQVAKSHGLYVASDA